MNLTDRVKEFVSRKILVIGDLMLDKYTYGKCDRVSPEAPVLVLKVAREDYIPGGAGNTANNIAALGSVPYVIGVIGKDEESAKLFSLLNSSGAKADYIVLDSERKTIVKQRVIGVTHQKQQLLRLDYEDGKLISSDIERKILENLDILLDIVDNVIISDYAKGTLTPLIFSTLIEKSRIMNKPVIIDPRPQNVIYYKNASIITPNIEEARKMVQDDKSDIESLGKKLMQQLNSRILITRGSEGMTLFLEDRLEHIPTKAREVADVSGAGDTVTAALAIGIANGLSYLEAAEFANYAAGVKVGKFGTAAVSLKEVISSMYSQR